MQKGNADYPCGRIDTDCYSGYTYLYIKRKWEMVFGLPMWYGVAMLFYLCMSAAAVLITVKILKPHKLDAIADDKEE